MGVCKITAFLYVFNVFVAKQQNLQGSEILQKSKN